jgi:hypothetical protein
MEEVRKIKKLQSQLKTAQEDADLFKISLANLTREYQAKLENVKRLKTEINKLNNPKKLRVSEHAIVRYFERVHKFDIAKIESQILSPAILDLVEKLGDSGTYPNGEFSVIIKNGTVTTVTT